MIASTRPPPALPSLKLVAGANMRGELAAAYELRPIVYTDQPPVYAPLERSTFPLNERHLNTTNPDEEDRRPAEAPGRRLLNHSASGSSVDEPGDAPAATGDKRARRKEQCRVNQAAYRKRKRQHEQELARYIKTLHIEIEDLVKQRDELTTQQQHTLSLSGQRRPQMTPDQEIEVFYQAMSVHEDISIVDHLEPPHAQIVALLALQHEEFESIDELQRQWKQHSRRFRHFTLRVLSAQHYDVGDHVMVRVTAEVEIAFVPESSSTSQSGEQWWRAPLVCGVQHQFEVDAVSHAISRVASEVDVIAGVVAAAKRVTRHVPRVLEEFMDLCGVQSYALPVHTTSV